MKRPYLQFYPGDWQSNPKLRCCSHTEKGIWLDVLCILHDQDEYGIARWPLKQLAQAVHASVSVLRKLVEKEVLKGADTGSTCEAFVYVPRSGRKDGSPVTLIPEQPGPIWYSSRMVRDEYVRCNSGAATRFNGSPPSSPSPRQGEDQGEGRVRAKPPHPSRTRASTSDSIPFSTTDPSSESSIFPSTEHFVFEEKESSPKNGDGETPSKKPVEVDTFTIWTLGVRAFVSSGITEKNARSFLGKQVQTYGKSAVARAVTETLAQEAIAPLEYMRAVLQTGSGERVQKCKVDNSMDAVRRVLEQKEAQRGTASNAT